MCFCEDVLVKVIPNKIQKEQPFFGCFSFAEKSDLQIKSIGYLKKQILQKKAPIRPIGYQNEQKSEKKGTNLASWLPK